MRELPNKTVFIDDSGKEHDVELKNDDIVVSKTGRSVYDKGMGGYLKIYQS